MPVQQTWRLRCFVPRGGGDLVLDGIDAVAAQSCLIESITSSHSPVSGDVASLLDASGGCRFAAADVASPHFFIEIVLVEPAALWGVRLLSTDPSSQPVMYLLEAQTSGKDAVLLGALTYSPWSQQPSAEPGFFQGPGWRQESTLTGSNLLGAYASGDGRVRFVSNWSPQAYVSLDYGESYSYFSAMRIDSAWVSNDGNLAYLCSTTAGVYRYLNGYLTAIAGTSGLGAWVPAVALQGQKVLLAGNARLWLSSDAGVTWTSLTVAGFTNGFVYCAMSEDGQTLVVTRSTGRVYLSVNGGAAWAEVVNAYTGGQQGWPCVSEDGRTILLRTDSGFPLLSRNGGLTWFTPAAIAVKGAGRGNALSADGVLLAISTGSQLFVRNNVTGVIRTFVLPWSASFYDVGGVSFARNGALVMFEVTLRSNSVSTIYSMWLPDDVYASPAAVPMQDVSEAQLVLSESVPFSADAVHGAQVTDGEDGGQGAIYGQVELYQEQGNAPLRRRVRLSRSADGMVVRECWSDEAGNYRFEGISAQQEYDAIAWDHTRQHRSVIANNLQAEVMP